MNNIDTVAALLKAAEFEYYIEDGDKIFITSFVSVYGERVEDIEGEKMYIQFKDGQGRLGPKALSLKRFIKAPIKSGLIRSHKCLESAYL